MKIIKNGIDMIFSGICMYILYPFLPKNIWIISEREDQAQDNGIAFFEYLNREKKNINPVYLLNKEYKDLGEVKKIGKVIIKGSFEHKLYFLKSRVVLSTEKNIIEPWGSRVFYKNFARLFPKKLKVFLQHGITDKDVSAVYGKNVSNIDVFVTAAKRESEFIVENFNYNKEEIAEVGFCRYDSLFNNKNKKEKIILYMPTWRRYLFDLANNSNDYIKEARCEFIKSEYYEKIQSLILNKQLIKYLENNDYKLIFIAHHGVNKLRDLFCTSSDNVLIYGSEEVKIKELLLKAEAFITDYSSIHFDSAYLENKNIYYQFDKENFFKEHAGKSYFDYEKDGFGPVIYEEDELIKHIITKEKELGIELKYKERKDKFFKYNDNKNCERLYNFIQSKL